MFHRIRIALSILLFPLMFVITASTAGASVVSPSAGTAHTVGTTVAAAQPVLRLGSHGSAVKTLQQRLATLHYSM